MRWKVPHRARAKKREAEAEAREIERLASDERLRMQERERPH
jgi:hypothetical protein